MDFSHPPTRDFLGCKASWDQTSFTTKGRHTCKTGRPNSHGLLNREIREFHDWLKWPGMAEEVPPDVRDSQGPMVRLAPQVACAGLIRDPSQLRGELAGTRPS